MSHIEKLEALVKAGDEATDGPWEMDNGANQPEIWVCGDAHVASIPRHTLASWRHDGPFICASANARDSIAWVLEVAKAAREFWDAADAADTEWDIPPSETNSHSRLYTARHALDALLAKETK